MCELSPLPLFWDKVSYFCSPDWDQADNNSIMRPKRSLESGSEKAAKQARIHASKILAIQNLSKCLTSHATDIKDHEKTIIGM